MTTIPSGPTVTEAVLAHSVQRYTRVTSRRGDSSHILGSSSDAATETDTISNSRVCPSRGARILRQAGFAQCNVAGSGFADIRVTRPRRSSFWRLQCVRDRFVLARRQVRVPEYRALAQARELGTHPDHSVPDHEQLRSCSKSRTSVEYRYRSLAWGRSSWSFPFCDPTQSIHASAIS